MSDDPDLGRHLEAYLAIRDALGLAAGARPRLLHSFVDHARGVTAPGTPIRGWVWHVRPNPRFTIMLLSHKAFTVR